MIDALHIALASCAANAPCLCQRKTIWPWKRDFVCARCIALDQFQLRQAAMSASAEKENEHV